MQKDEETGDSKAERIRSNKLLAERLAIPLSLSSQFFYFHDYHVTFAWKEDIEGYPAAIQKGYSLPYQENQFESTFKKGVKRILRASQERSGKI